jgi:predicted ATP-grasp superfamily ATP-dependent carboligase
VIDLFADADTQRIATTLKCDDFAHAAKLASQLPPMPWLYTGGLENHPAIVDEISKHHSLLGNPGEVLKRVRDPFRLADVVRGGGGHFPAMAGHRKPGFIGKRFQSAGGLGIDVATSDYYQEFIRGEPVSAAFEGDRLLGVSRQLCGTPWLHAPEFHYAGNLRDDASPHRDEFARLGRHLAVAFGLKHFWGLDAIASERGLFILEVNPRYTASMELCETPMTGKAIYYAKASLAIPATGPWRDSPFFADIPSIDVAEAGQPVLSIFADARTPEACLVKLKSAAAELDRFFGVAS